MNEIKPVKGWTISAHHASSFARTFNAYPDQPIDAELKTFERLGTRYIDATYPMHVRSVTISFRWDEKKREWWWQGMESSTITNEKTGEQYKSGWRSESIRSSYSQSDVTTPSYLRELAEAAHPRSTITVTEVPA